MIDPFQPPWAYDENGRPLHWRDKEPTEKQRLFFVRRGLKIAGLNRGQARDVIKRVVDQDQEKRYQELKEAAEKREQREQEELQRRNGGAPTKGPGAGMGHETPLRVFQPE